MSALHYARVYGEFLKVNAAKALGFRANFIIMLLLDLVFYATNLWTYELVLQNLGAPDPWGREQFMLYIAFIMFWDWLQTFFVGSAFWQFTRMVRQGELDYALLRPLHPLFSCFAGYVRFDCILNLVPALGILIYYAHAARLSLGAWVALPFLSLMSFAFTTLVEITITTFILWTKEGVGIHFMRFQLSNMARWPDFMYRGGARRFFMWVIPGLMYYSPYVRFLVNPSDWRPLVGAAGLMLLWGIALLKFWDFSIRYYESASS